MAKLYWRIKVNGKWTWKAAYAFYDNGVYTVHELEEEEE